MTGTPGRPEHVNVREVRAWHSSLALPEHVRLPRAAAIDLLWRQMCRSEVVKAPPGRGTIIVAARTVVVASGSLAWRGLCGARSPLVSYSWERSLFVQTPVAVPVYVARHPAPQLHTVAWSGSGRDTR